MKNILLILLSFLFITSCEDTKINETAFQAKVDNRLYQAADARVTLNDDGSLTILGSSQNEGMTIKLNNLSENNYLIGEGSSNFAIYEDEGGNIYSTQPDGKGEVTLSEVNEINKTISGTFYFNAILPGIDTIYVSKGTLFNIPFTDGSETDPINAGSFTAKIDANDFLPIIVTARKTDSKISISANNINSSITVELTSDVAMGNYTIPQSGFKAIYANADGSQTTINGLIVVHEHNPTDKTLRGTFRFKTDQSQITEGKFNITYQ